MPETFPADDTSVIPARWNERAVQRGAEMTMHEMESVRSSPVPQLGAGDRRIILVRHAETEWSKAGRHTGRSDIPLDASGRAGAIALRARLSGLDPARVLTSPLQRARMTCELAGFAADAIADEDLVEWDYGRYEGLTTADIRVERPGWNPFLHGCPQGESARDVGRRADRVISRLLAFGGQPVVVFSHAHLLRVLAVRWIGQAAEEGRHLVLGTCSVSSLGFEREERAITSWNL